jgi:hypothetical protein
MTRIQDHPNDRLEELLPWRWGLAKIPQVVIRQA